MGPLKPTSSLQHKETTIWARKHKTYNTPDVFVMKLRENAVNKCWELGPTSRAVRNSHRNGISEETLRRKDVI